jgi:hypothetical protein
LQAGRIARTSEGVYVNVQRDVDEDTLKSYQDKSQKINGIWFLPNEKIDGIHDFGFAPYESFTTGIQDANTFVTSGLARVLEHTQEKEAKNLRLIASEKNYPNGVNVWDFEPPKKLISRVLSLDSYGGNQLCVDGGNWTVNFGFVFGCLRKQALLDLRCAQIFSSLFMIVIFRSVKN